MPCASTSTLSRIGCSLTHSRFCSWFGWCGQQPCSPWLKSTSVLTLLPRSGLQTQYAFPSGRVILPALLFHLNPGLILRYFRLSPQIDQMIQWIQSDVGLIHSMGRWDRGLMLNDSKIKYYLWWWFSKTALSCWLWAHSFCTLTWDLLFYVWTLWRSGDHPALHLQWYLPHSPLKLLLVLDLNGCWCHLRSLNLPAVFWH